MSSFETHVSKLLGAPTSPKSEWSTLLDLVPSGFDLLSAKQVAHQSLELLANATGGEVLKLSELDTIAAKIKGKTELKSLHREATLWDNWLILFLLICVYSVDVGIRRVMGLV